jgi:hypothetical protein
MPRTQPRFDGMPERVAEVQPYPPGPTGALTLVRDDHLDLRPGAALDGFGDLASAGRAGISPGDRIAASLEQLEQSLVAQRGHLDRLAECRPPMPLGERVEQRHIDHDIGRLVERTDEILALRQVDRGLATDR